METAVRFVPGHAAQPGWIFSRKLRGPSCPERGKDLVLLDTRKVEGSGELVRPVCRNFLHFFAQRRSGDSEGDPRFSFDEQSGRRRPTVPALEEWGGGGDYWGGINMTCCRWRAIPLAPETAGKGEESSRRQDRISLSFSAGRSHAFWKECRDPPGARRQQ